MINYLETKFEERAINGRPQELESLTVLVKQLEK
jgi:hypothetical protein